MATPGTLEKLLIQAYTKPDYTGPKADEFVSYLNPNEITISHELEWEAAQGSGTTNSRMDFKKSNPESLSLTFVIDGTGANGREIDVQEKVKEFRSVTGYSGDIHRPHYLIVTWGTLPVTRCVLKSASIAYKLFTPNGVPLRAVITASFTGNSDDKTRVAIAQDGSPDLTHIRLVKAGDTLPAMCFNIYGDPRYYLAVATENRLDNFRKLKPGTKVFFPPLQR